MSRKKQAPKRNIIADSRYSSITLSKFINAVMYHGKRSTAEKIIYNALDKIKDKTKFDPLKVFNDAVNKVRPNL